MIEIIMLLQIFSTLEDYLMMILFYLPPYFLELLHLILISFHFCFYLFFKFYFYIFLQKELFVVIKFAVNTTVASLSLSLQKKNRRKILVFTIIPGGSVTSLKPISALMSLVCMID